MEKNNTSIYRSIDKSIDRCRRLVQVFDAQLESPRRAGGQNLPERGRPEEVAGKIEVRLVEEIEPFEPQLQRAAGERDFARERNVDVLEARTVEGVAADVAEGPVRRQPERIGVEPPRRPGIGNIRIADEIRAIVRAESKAGAAGVSCVYFAVRRAPHR